jgi:hypothetical protein
MEPLGKTTELAEFRGVAPSTLVSEMDDKRLIVIGDGMTGQITLDSGRNWGTPFQYMQEGAPMEPSLNKGNILRLQDGRLATVYSRQENHSTANYKTRTWYFTTSDDDGKNWTKGTALDIPAMYDLDKGFFVNFLWGNLLQLTTGRLIAPAYWEIAGRHPAMPPAGDDPVTATIQGTYATRIADGHLYEAAMGGCYNYYSDDLGATWSICTGSTMVWPLPSEGGIGGFGVCWEPVVIELKDGRVMMFMRTNVGRLYQSFSSDGGENWLLPETTELASGDVPCWLGRLRTTGDLVVVWNQSSKDEIERGYSRGRLSIAVSSDEAASWSTPITLELSGGLDDVDQVELPPIAHVRAKENLGTLPDNFTRSHYPRLSFVQENVVVTFNYDYHLKGKHHRDSGLLVVPESSLYR